jgi:SAM-dependent methyltransferase
MVLKLFCYFVRIFDKVEKSHFDYILKDEDFGLLRGTPVDRILIESYLKSVKLKEFQKSKEANFLEIGSTEYSKLLAPSPRHFEFIYAQNKNIRLEKNKLLGDIYLGIPKEYNNFFDLIVLTQFLSFLKKPEIIMTNIIKSLKPNGIIVGSEPFLMPVSTYDHQKWGDYRRYTKSGLNEFFSSLNLNIDFEINELGNALTSSMSILGYSHEDLNKYKSSVDINNKKSKSHYTLTSYRITKLV